ncbi:MAG: leucine--tRNA ligase [Acidimicrobiales bacterium]
MSNSVETLSDLPPYRYSAALAADIEARWQERWAAEGTFEAPNPTGPLADAGRPAGDRKLFVLDMFPYPSGVGLHVGHPLGYIGTDVYSRFQRMQGTNVLYSMGFDAFGLPAEQYAVQTGQHPAVTTAANVANMRRQLRRLGLSHDLRRSIDTTDPDYYRWTQWIFLQIYNSWYDSSARRARPIGELEAEFAAGSRATPDGRAWSALDAAERHAALDAYRLAYLSDAPVNWCPGLGTVVANEEVTAEGRSDRGNFPVFRRTMRQWMMRITAYADRLLADLDLLQWTDALKSMQRNWIGRSEGARVRFATAAGDLEVYTTRPDTLFGATFMVVAPEHPMVAALTAPAWPAGTDPRWIAGAGTPAQAIAEYRRAAASKSDLARQETKDKTGVFTGSFATNPVTGEPVPVFVADYVLMGYGTGAIMAVPCGDQRDFEYARAFGLPIPAIQEPPAAWFAERGIASSLDTATWPEAFVGDGRYVQSGMLDGDRSIADAKRRITDWLEERGRGTGAVQYKLRDWLFSRQRYWGEPFPIVYDANGNALALPSEMLPVLLPDTDQFSPRTFDPDDEHSDPESPLDRLDHFKHVTLDLGDGPQPYTRDTNVMPQWAGSCWYELRYCDPTNTDTFVDPAVERYWMGPQPEVRPDHPGGVDLYVGGVEHAVLHLLYARFWHKVLYDLGHVSSKEPYTRLFNQGYIQAFAYTDERGLYVEAAEVEERDGGFWHRGKPVNREYGKMGKSLRNAVSPDEMYDAYGADTLRLYEMSMGPLDASRPWNTRDVIGMHRFLQRVWRNLVDEGSGALRVDDSPADDETRRLLHKTIAFVGEEMEALRFNTAIAKLIEFNNHLTGVVAALGACPADVARTMVQLLSPLVPHVAEELWAKLGHTESITYVAWPVADPALLVDDTVEIPVQVNGKVRSRIVVPASADAAALETAARVDDKVVAALAGASPRKVIVVPGRLVNLVV